MVRLSRNCSAPAPTRPRSASRSDDADAFAFRDATNRYRLSRSETAIVEIDLEDRVQRVRPACGSIPSPRSRIGLFAWVKRGVSFSLRLEIMQNFPLEFVSGLGLDHLGVSRRYPALRARVITRKWTCEKDGVKHGSKKCTEKDFRRAAGSFFREDGRGLVSSFSMPKFASAQGGTVNFYNWDTYIGENTLEDFTDATGIDVQYGSVRGQRGTVRQVP